MTSKEHQELVAIIRGVSDNMRRDFLKSGGNYEKVWQEHLLADDVRKQYAQSMLKLATSIWPQSDSRIHWCYEVIKDYFHKDGMEKCLKRHQRCLLWQKQTSINSSNIWINTKYQFSDGKYKLLDVGSCYNPFSKFQGLETVSVDLTPAVQDVYQCDFLKLKISLPSGSVQDLPKLPGSLSQLEEQSFHIIVFSLYLSYLPAAEQRLLSCYKAWKLLKENGILLIITPDSKSQHCNASMIKSWKTALEDLGFMRIVYEKRKHLHCMAYRKTSISTFDPNSEVCMGISKLMYIPQDFKKFLDSSLPDIRTEKEDDSVKNIFCELPFCDDV